MKYLVIEDGPALGSGRLSLEDDRLFTGLAHPFSLIIWFWKKAESPAVDVHGKEALNAAITFVLCVTFPLSFIMRILPNALIGLFSFLLMILNLAVLALFIYGLILARQGKLLKYPYNLRLIK